MTNNYWKWIVAAAGLACLTGCIGENANEANAKCEMEVIKLRNAVRSEIHPLTMDEKTFIANCMQADGYAFNTLVEHCKITTPNGKNYHFYDNIGCYEPFTIENKIRRWIER